MVFDGYNSRVQETISAFSNEPYLRKTFFVRHPSQTGGKEKRIANAGQEVCQIHFKNSRCHTQETCHDMNNV